MQTTVISITATRAPRTPMTAPSTVLLILVVLSSCEVAVGDILSVVVMVKVVVGGDTLSAELIVLVSLSLVVVGIGDCVTCSNCIIKIVADNCTSNFIVPYLVYLLSDT